MRARWWRRDRVAAIHRLAVYLEFQRDELPWLEDERTFGRRAKEKALDVVSFLADLAAHQRVVGIAVPTRGQRLPEPRLRHAVGSRLGAELKRRLIAHHCFLPLLVAVLRSALEGHDFLAVRYRRGTARVVGLRCVAVIRDPADVPLAELLDQALGERRIRTRLVGAARRAALRVFDERAVLVVRRAPYGREVVHVVIDALARVLVHEPLG